MRMFNKILCPVDFSHSSEAALRLAGALAQDKASELIVVYVEPSLDDMVSSGALPAHQAAQEHLETQSHLCDLIEKCLPAQVPVRAVVREGAVVAHLLQLVAEEAVDLMVVAPQMSRPRHPAAAHDSCALLSPVAEQLLEGAPCPVLVVHNTPLAPPWHDPQERSFPQELSAPPGAVHPPGAVCSPRAL